MYQLYIKKETGFETKKLIAEFKDSDSAYVRIETELAKDKELKYIL